MHGMNIKIIWLYSKTECNDVAVCRVRRYGRSTMVQKDVLLRHLWRWLCYTHLCVVVTDLLSLSIIARVRVQAISVYFREG
jgi:hypothetical protein